MYINKTYLVKIERKKRTCVRQLNEVMNSSWESVWTIPIPTKFVAMNTSGQWKW